MRKGLLVTILILGGLAACTGISARRMDAQLAAQRATTPYPSGGDTYVSLSADFGYQIEYLGRGGRVQLWFPGRDKALTGAWKRTGNRMCYHYAGREPAGYWTCDSVANLQRHTVAWLKGDPYGLAKGTVPFRRSRCRLPKGVTLLKTVRCR